MKKFREKYPEGSIMLDVEMTNDAYKVIVTIGADAAGAILARNMGYVSAMDQIEAKKASLLSEAMGWVFPSVTTESAIPTTISENASPAVEEAPEQEARPEEVPKKKRKYTKRTVVSETPAKPTEESAGEEDASSTEAVPASEPVPVEEIPSGTVKEAEPAAVPPEEAALASHEEPVPTEEEATAHISAEEPASDKASEESLSYEDACAMPFTVNDSFKENPIVQSLLGQTIGEVYKQRPSMFRLIIKKNGAPEETIAAMKVVVAQDN